MKKIKKGDEIIVIAGKDKGKKGKVSAVLGDRVLVEGINQVKKHVKANPNAGVRGGIELKTMSMHVSNVMPFDSSTNARSRIGIRQLKDTKERVRYFKKSNQLVEVNV